jgi:Sulfotransferase family
MTASAESPTVLHTSQQKRVPDFFIVGHAKCGTTALYEMLRRHPQIFMPDYKAGAGKEPWYFSRSNPQPQTSGKRSISFTGRYPMTLDEYLLLFADARDDQRIGEASTSYLWSPTAAAAIAAVQPAARIIAILREPVSFLRSLHLQLLQNHHECEKDFRKALALDDARREGRDIPKQSYWPSALIYSERVRYVEQLSRYHAVFSPEQILVLIYDDFQRDNEGTVRAVLRFLGADDSAPIDVVAANPTVRLRSERVRGLMRSIRRGHNPLTQVVRAGSRAIVPQQLRHDVERRLVYGSPHPPDPELTLELRCRFKGEVVAASEYLGRDLVTLWGYDNIE